jgi:hypothetical protein
MRFKSTIEDLTLGTGTNKRGWSDGGAAGTTHGNPTQDNQRWRRRCLHATPGHKTTLKAEYETLDAEWLVLWPVVFNGVILRLYDVQTVPGPQAIFRQFPSFPSNFQHSRDLTWLFWYVVISVENFDGAIRSSVAEQPAWNWCASVQVWPKADIKEFWLKLCILLFAALLKFNQLYQLQQLHNSLGHRRTFFTSNWRGHLSKRELSWLPLRHKTSTRCS